MLYNKLAKKVRIRIAPNHIQGLEIGYLLYELSSFSNFCLVQCVQCLSEDYMKEGFSGVTT